MIDSSDHVSGKTGLSPTVTISKNGGAFASPAGSVTEIGSGLYKVAANAGDSDTLGPLVLHATATGADPTDWLYPVVAYDPLTVAVGALRPLVSGRQIAVAATTGIVTAELDPTVAAQITAIETFATRVTTGIVQDGAVWQFTANMLELAPSATGVDELIALQEEILAAVNGYISGLTAVAVESPGSITGFPESLRIGDSYTDILGRGIQIPIVDVNGNPISSVGSKNFADAEATFVIKRYSDTEVSRIVSGTATFIDPPGTGTSAGETPYALIEIPSSETAKGLTKYRYTGLLTFTWPYVGTGTDAEVMTFETGTITFET